MSLITLLPPPSDSSSPTPPLPLGSITPRLWTPPLRRLTPQTSYGYAVIAFAALVLGAPLDPWQQWLVIHLGELLPDGRPRFRQVLVLVARQNGKTHLCRVLTLFWMFVEKWPVIFGTSTNLDYAREQWQATMEEAEENDTLAEQIPNRHKRETNGQQTFWNVHRSRYKIGAANRKGGRSLVIDRAIGDELREQHTWDSYNAVTGAMNARSHAQLVYISNMGDYRAVVLNELRAGALEFLETGVGDNTLGIFEWSAPAGSHPTDVHAHAMANPQLGRRIGYETIAGPAARVSRPGADQEALTGFLTEILCVSVPTLNPAIDAAAWERANIPAALDLTQRRRLAVVLDVAPDGQHATLVAALDVAGGKVRVEVVHAWTGPACLLEVRAELPGWIARVKPRKFGWFPKGPAAELDADLRDRRKAGRASWPPRGVDVAELTMETPAVCMGLAGLIKTGQLLQSGDPLLTAQVEQTEKLVQKDDRWVFQRRGAGHCDAVYAVAGAVHLARTMPTPREVSSGTHVAG